MKCVWNFLFVSALLLIATISWSQSYGHTNYGNLLAGLAEVQAADKELATLNEKMSAEFQIKIKAFQTKYESFSKRANSGQMSKIEIQKEQATLEEENNKLAAKEQEMQRDLLKKREELLRPIVEKVNKAIEKVSLDNGFLMIFDVSVGGLLFAPETRDVTDLIRKELGVQ